MNKLHLAAYGLILKDQSLLLIRKKRGPYKNLLDLPGGALADNETIEDALKREIKEETGIEAHAFSLLDNYCILVPVSDEQLTLQHVGLIYSVTDYNEATLQKNISSSDSDAPDWYDIAELTQEHLSPFAYKAVTYLKEILL